ncbi:MAG TPA: oxygen-independent coproporphyrinogen III oxidase [Blastocatellia bacterium]|nr:oxygen-independent coproporphyrinogen III oxidase [Blastocatellia bacterium]
MTMNEIAITVGSESLNISPLLIDKYNKPGPRYTSYPTAPEWNDDFGPGDYADAIDAANQTDPPSSLSLYFHLPFCESLCLFCGCNVVISKRHDVTDPYLASIKSEINRVSEHLSSGRKVEQLHWGGGTPTFLNVPEIEGLFKHIADHFEFSPSAEIGVEVDPRATSDEQCRTLRQIGFNRLSMGIQDFNPVVQKTIHRIQPYEMTRHQFDYCRELGFESINVDLIYGLPHQTAESFGETVDKVVDMNPDRIAMFSYAHVPWLKKQQGSFAKHLPEGLEKFKIFALGIRKLVDAGYRYVGMDHFARPNDELCVAQDDRTLHRNFQGYTTKSGCDLLAFGVSAISVLDNAYAQNYRDVAHYYEAIEGGGLPTMRGMTVTGEDKLRRSVINRLLCHTVVMKSDVEAEFGINFDEHFANELQRLRDLENDGLLKVSADRLETTGLGRLFIRIIAMIFDAYLNKPVGGAARQFSKTL